MVRIGKPDASLTGLAGLGVIDELVGALGVVHELDRAVGPIKQRERGLTGGQLLVGLATGQLCGQDSLTGLDRVRADAASVLLEHAPVPASTTAAQLAARFGPQQLAGIETGLSAVYSRWLGVLPAQLRGRLVLTNPTIDVDATGVFPLLWTQVQAAIWLMSLYPSSYSWGVKYPRVECRRCLL